jgi:hypothetical protein
MDKAPGVLIANQRVPRSRPAPRLRLLVELEPRHRVFFSNLADLLLSRRVPQVPITSRPARFWNDVFVPSGVPWSSFMESMLLHLLLTVLFVWGQSRVWVSVKLFPQRDAFQRSITYYPPARTFPAAGSRAPNIRPRSRVTHASARPPAHQPAMPVTPEHKPSIVTPPDIKQATAKLPNLLGSHAVAPMVPFAATVGPQRNALPGPSGVVAPQPQVDQATARRPALPQASAVVPAPELGGPSAGRPIKAPNTSSRVVPPPPSVQNAGNSARAGRLSSLSGTGTNVVPPSPSVQGAGNAAGDARLSSMAGPGSQVVPPPPSVQGAGTPAGTGRLSSLPGTRPNVVPPPPSVQTARNASGDGRLGAMGSASSQVVAPPPSVQGSGLAGGARLGSISGTGPNVVPPPPSVHGAGSAAGDARLGTMAGAGSQVVPPPPSVRGSGSAGGTRLGSLSDADPGVVPPPTSVAGTGNSGASGPGKLLDPMDPLPADASATPAGNNENKATVEELPVGLLGIVFAAPGTSFFSNFEVFIAKRRVGKDQLQLIKLVYEFLPYQRRLSEYNLNNLPPRVIKLRVTPDPSCDESLWQMIQSDTDPTRAATEYAKLPAALRNSDLSAVLPCYRTTAEDFQKAMSGPR